jgi:hypothetical protein
MTEYTKTEKAASAVLGLDDPDDEEYDSPPRR